MTGISAVRLPWGAIAAGLALADAVVRRLRPPS